MSQVLDSVSSLTQSIGEHSVDSIGRDRLLSLKVLFDSRDSRCKVSFVLADNSDAEQLRAIDRLLDIQMLFLDEASIEFCIEDESSLEKSSSRHSVSQRQYSLT